ncbi:hypothetical protein ES708_35194 [subsurface metagenome]
MDRNIPLKRRVCIGSVGNLSSYPVLLYGNVSLKSCISTFTGGDLSDDSIGIYSNVAGIGSYVAFVYSNIGYI